MAAEPDIPSPIPPSTGAFSPGPAPVPVNPLGVWNTTRGSGDCEGRAAGGGSRPYAEDDPRPRRWEVFVGKRGERYRGCRLENYACELPEQTRAVGLLYDYCATISERVKQGEGVVLFGPRGTGKDHLLVALARAAIGAGLTVDWQNGLDLFGDVRDAITSKSLEKALLTGLVRPDVLYLSDPLPLAMSSGSGSSVPGALSEFQASMLFRILDARYSRRRPTWCSVNVQSGRELDERLAPQNADRLRDNALAIHCHWPSYRRARQ